MHLDRSLGQVSLPTLFVPLRLDQASGAGGTSLCGHGPERKQVQWRSEWEQGVRWGRRVGGGKMTVGWLE